MIRRLDLGAVSPLRSQAMYHGLAEAMDETTPDTIVFCSPAAPYFCVGYHQNAADVLDLALCGRRGWPVLRRKIGGGAVYLDGAQLFYQAIVHRARAPFAVDRIYATYLAAPVRALRRLGLDARLHPPNEIEVGGRRIAGTGGGHIGEAVVVVGNVLLDFPDRHMARAWRAPSAPFRRLAREGLRRYLTTLARELPVVPPMESLREAIADAYAETLGEALRPGEMTPREIAAVETAERELESEAFVLEREGRSGPGLKIARGVYVFEGRATGRDVRVSLRVRHGVVDGVAVRGADARVARRLVGRQLDALSPGPPAANPADAVGRLLAGEARAR
jgi:lipoate-protein ligase A